MLDENDNWLIPDDVPLIGNLLRAWNPAAVGKRIQAAIWYFEMTARNFYSDIRWPLLVTALESLVRIKNEQDRNGRPVGSTRAFVSRLAQLGARDPALTVSEGDLRDMYEKRSDLVHALAVVAMDEVTKTVYRNLENLVRNVLRKAILEPSFAAIFASDQHLAAALPI